MNVENLFGIVLFVSGIVKSVFALYKSERPGFGIRLFICQLLLTAGVIFAGLLIPWIAGVALHPPAGIWPPAVVTGERVISIAIMKALSWACRRVCRAGCLRG